MSLNIIVKSKNQNLNLVHKNRAKWNNPIRLLNRERSTFVRMLIRKRRGKLLANLTRGRIREAGLGK